MPQLVAAVAAVGAAKFAAAKGLSLIATAGLTLGAYSVVSSLLVKKPKFNFDTSFDDSPLAGRTNLGNATDPAVWLLGTTRAFGKTVWIHDAGRKLYLVQVLSEGSIESIEKVFIDGEEVELTRSGTLLTASQDSRYYQGFRCREYFAADGSEGAEIRAINSTLDWGTNHKLEGKSYVFLTLTQNEKFTDTDTREENLYRNIPRIEFVVKGLKISYPTGGDNMSTPAFTANAAKIRAWYLVERREVKPNDVNQTYLTASISLCDESISLGGSTSYPDSVKRYEINGAFNSSNDTAEIERQMDIAMSGHTIEWDGEYLIRAGGERSSRTTITENDIISDTSVAPVTDWSDRFNTISVTMVQSNLHNWVEHSLTVDDEEVIDRDGEALPFGGLDLNLVTDPVQAYNIIHGLLLDARASMKITIDCMPRTDWTIATLIPGDKVTLTLKEYGITDKAFKVLSNTFNGDFSVSLELQEWAANRYADVIVFPPLGPRDIRFSPSRADGVENLSVAFERYVIQDGSTRWRIESTWDANQAYKTELILEGDDAVISRAEAERGASSNDDLIAGTSGEHTIKARHFSDTTKASLFSIASINLLREPLPAALVGGVVQSGNTMRISLDPVDRRDVAGVVLRYNFTPLNSRIQIQQITESNWDTATELDNLPVLPAIGGTNKIRFSTPIPRTGRYRIYARLVDKTDTLGELFELGVYKFSLPTQETFNLESWPSWGGHHNNTAAWDYDEEHPCILVASPGRPADNRLRNWKGVTGWPFGSPANAGLAFSEANSSYYDSEILDCGDHAGNREVTISPRYTGVNNPANLFPDFGILSSNDKSAWDQVSYNNANQVVANKRYFRARVYFNDTGNRVGLERLSLNVNSV